MTWKIGKKGRKKAVVSCRSQRISRNSGIWMFDKVQKIPPRKSYCTIRISTKNVFSVQYVTATTLKLILGNFPKDHTATSTVLIARNYQAVSACFTGWRQSEAPRQYTSSFWCYGKLGVGILFTNHVSDVLSLGRKSTRFLWKRTFNSFAGRRGIWCGLVGARGCFMWRKLYSMCIIAEVLGSN